MHLCVHAFGSQRTMLGTTLRELSLFSEMSTTLAFGVVDMGNVMCGRGKLLLNAASDPQGPGPAQLFPGAGDVHPQTSRAAQAGAPTC